MKIFTIFDRVSEKSGNIFTCSTIAEAERQFYDALKNAQTGSLFNTHPQDFTLFCLGEFDEKSISIVDYKPFEVCKGKLPTLPAEALLA